MKLIQCFKNFFHIDDEKHDRYFYDADIYRFVIGRRCDNFYYADISYNGLSYYRSRWLQLTDRDLEEMKFGDWFPQVMAQITKDFEIKIMQKLNK